MRSIQIFHKCSAVFLIGLLIFTFAACSKGENGAISSSKVSLVPSISSEPAESLGSILASSSVPQSSKEETLSQSSETAKTEQSDKNAQTEQSSSKKATTQQSSSKKATVSQTTTSKTSSKAGGNTAGSTSSFGSTSKIGSSSKTSTASKTPSQSTRPQTAQGYLSEDVLKQVVELVNAERKKVGLSALTIDTELQANAEVRAKELVTKFDHTRPDGSSCFTAVTVQYRTVGENIAMGYRTPQEVMTGWMNSQGHRENILKSSFTKIGVGAYQTGGVIYWVQLFVG